MHETIPYLLTMFSSFSQFSVNIIFVKQNCYRHEHVLPNTTFGNSKFLLLHEPNVSYYR